MLLTIGMIVKNEEKYLRKCLTALKPILEQVDSELIITDTGSTDGTVEIAKEFTENVLHFDWIDDFSAARNTAIERARGEWFMFLDADEIFKSCNRIIKFFNSGEYKGYDSATYIVRSYNNLRDMTKFSDFSAHRMVKMTPETRFVKPVHEHLSSFGGRIKVLTDVADHYGYAFSDKEVSEAKFQRNIAILQKVFEEEKDSDPSIYGQMFDTYRLKDEEKALEYLDIGIEATREKNAIYCFGLYCRKANHYHMRREYEPALETCREYFAFRETLRPSEVSTDVEMYYYLALTCAVTGKFDEAIKAYKRYFGLYDRVTRGELKTLDMLLYSFDSMSEKSYRDSCDIFIKICCHVSRYKEALDGYRRFPISIVSQDAKYARERVDKAIDILENVGFQHLGAIYDGCDPSGKDLILSRLRVRVLSNAKNNRQEIISAVLSLKELAPAQKAVFTIYKAHFAASGAGAERTATYLKKFGADSAPELLCFLIEEKQDISAYAKSVGGRLANLAVGCIRQCPGFAEAAAEYPFEQMSKTALYPLSVIYKTILIHRSRRGEDIEAVFESYGRVGLKYFDVFPNDTPEAEEMIPAALAFNITAERRSGDYKACIGDLKLFLRSDPNFDTIVGQYREKIKAELKLPEPRSEMEQLAEMVKKNVRSMISAGDYINAAETLSELARLVPNDPDIAELNALLSRRRGGE